MVFEVLIQEILGVISENLVLGVVLGMIVEEVLVPVPSPAIPMAAGTFIEAATIPDAVVKILFLIALPGSIASVVSSYFVYSIAYFGGEPVIKEYGRYIDVSWEEIQQLERYFDHGREKYYVALFRAIPVVPLSMVSGGAGLFQMNWKQYGLWSFIGMMPRNFFLAYLGWTVRDNFMAIASRIDKVSTAVGIAITAIVLGVLIYRNIGDIRMRILRGV